MRFTGDLLYKKMIYLTDGVVTEAIHIVTGEKVEFRLSGPPARITQAVRSKVMAIGRDSTLLDVLSYALSPDPIAHQA